MYASSTKTMEILGNLGDGGDGLVWTVLKSILPLAMFDAFKHLRICFDSLFTADLRTKIKSIHRGRGKIFS